MPHCWPRLGSQIAVCYWCFPHFRPRFGSQIATFYWCFPPFWPQFGPILVFPTFWPQFVPWCFPHCCPGGPEIPGGFEEALGGRQAPESPGGGVRRLEAGPRQYLRRSQEARRLQEAPARRPRRPQEAPGGRRRQQKAPGGPRRPQEAPGGPRHHPLRKLDHWGPGRDPPFFCHQMQDKVGGQMKDKVTTK